MLSGRQLVNTLCRRLLVCVCDFTTSVRAFRGPLGSFLDLQIVQFKVAFLVQKVNERLAKGARRDKLGKTHEQRGQQHQIGEHGDQKGDGDEDSERTRAVKFAHGEHQEPKEQHDGRVHHAHARLSNGAQNRSPNVPAI